MNAKQKGELKAELNNLARQLEYSRDSIRKVISLAKKVDDIDFKRTFIGELESYLDPSLHAFIEDPTQPGSVASLREHLEDE